MARYPVVLNCRYCHKSNIVVVDDLLDVNAYVSIVDASNNLNNQSSAYITLRNKAGMTFSKEHQFDACRFDSLLRTKEVLPLSCSLAIFDLFE